jgi:transposase InsO family protein
MKGKLTRLPFQGHFDPTQVPLQVIHGDIVGPITPSTNSGKRYFLTLVDQHTGYISVTLLKQKSEAMDAFLAFKIFFEKQTGHFIKKLITDGGGEFVNKNLNNALESFGIQHNISPPYTPQHNGVAERANKTIINMARCMLSQSNLAKEWWGEAVRTAMAVTNCLPSVRRGKVSPIQLMFGKRPNYGVFRPFGCKTWMIKPKHLRTTKFDSVSWDGIVIGYSNDYSAYKVIRLPDKSIIETKHAYFDESVFPTLGALNPSVNHFPHSGLPDFESAALFPFQEEDDLNTFQDEGCVPDEQEEERMVLDDDEVREQEQPLEDQAEDPAGTREDSLLAPPPR